MPETFEIKTDSSVSHKIANKLNSNDPRFEHKLCVFGYIRENFKEFEYIIPTAIIKDIILFSDPSSIIWKINQELIDKCINLIEKERTYLINPEKQNFKTRILGPFIIISFHGFKFKYQCHLQGCDTGDTLKIGLLRFLDIDFDINGNNDNNNNDNDDQQYKELKFWLEHYRINKNNSWRKIVGIEGHNRNSDSYWLPFITINDLKNMKEIIFNIDPLRLTITSQIDFIRSKLLHLEPNATYYYRKDIYIKKKVEYIWNINYDTLQIIKNSDNGQEYKFASKNFDLINKNWYICIKPRHNEQVEVGLRLVKIPYNVWCIKCKIKLLIDNEIENDNNNNNHIYYQEFTRLKSSGWLWKKLGKTKEFFNQNRKKIKICAKINIIKAYQGNHNCGKLLSQNEWKQHNIL